MSCKAWLIQASRGLNSTNEIFAAKKFRFNFNLELRIGYYALIYEHLLEQISRYEVYSIFWYPLLLYKLALSSA